ncbi:DUF3149 domain-containing protein [Jeongeupia sp. USM3]|uniref:DUF3149 domain-containing protein n=1 Tax=Jeongeupia sp. USM3 TaxID=1906741 RepID=UPI00089DE78F|nr:DUF3149 domain-containing protein [Jeongeupia sp. USM3]AOX99800.1 hypothetical protein BJP62_04610 [Jeongeupia sp. USM3]
MENTPLQALFTSDIGLLSLFTIVFICGMAGYLFWFVRRNVLNAEASERTTGPDDQTAQSNGSSIR